LVVSLLTNVSLAALNTPSPLSRNNWTTRPAIGRSSALRPWPVKSSTTRPLIPAVAGCAETLDVECRGREQRQKPSRGL